MISRQELADYLHEYLNCSIFDDHTVNGLQVEGKDEILKVITGVSPSVRLFEQARLYKVDAVILHHGLFWQRGTPHPFALTGLLKRRVALLLEKNISLFAYHLPLDGHDRVGNNSLIAQQLGLKDVRIVPEAKVKFPLIAFGEVGTLTNLHDFALLADEKLHTKGIALGSPKTVLRRVAVVSGGGGSCWADAKALGADLLVTGEISENIVREAEEAGICLYAGGHYNTEKWGVRALGEHLALKFGISAQFVDIPNPI